MLSDLVEWGYKQGELLGAICYFKEYDKTITIVIHKSCVFVQNKLVLRQEEDLKKEKLALKQGRYELSQVKF